jgi:hypothetical protein
MGLASYRTIAAEDGSHRLIKPANVSKIGKVTEALPFPLRAVCDKHGMDEIVN